MPPPRPAVAPHVPPAEPALRADPAHPTAPDEVPSPAQVLAAELELAAVHEAFLERLTALQVRVLELLASTADR